MLFQCAGWRHSSCVAQKCTCTADNCAQWNDAKGGFACVRTAGAAKQGGLREAASVAPAATAAGDMGAASFGARACPVGCTTWFDGCNDCACVGPGELGACSFNPDCKVAHRAHCKRYRGHNGMGGVTISNAMGGIGVANPLQ